MDEQRVVIEILARRPGGLVTIGFVGRDGGPGYVMTAARARAFTPAEAQRYREDVLDEMPAMILRTRPAPCRVAAIV
jgi:hypothetical protein